MELNGIANIAAIIEMALWDGKINEETYKEIQDQLDVLERYMLVASESLKKNKPIPYWHLVRDSRYKFPNNQELSGGTYEISKNSVSTRKRSD